MKSSIVRRWVFLATLAASSACHDIPQAPIIRTTPGPEWIRITMDDGVTDYPSWGGLDLLRDADGGFHVISAETEFGRLRYAGCVQNCQDPARWLPGTVN